MLRVAFAKGEQRPQVESLARSIKPIADFPFTWTRWQNWEKFPPLLALDYRGQVVGLNAFTTSPRTRLVNLYYIGVALDYRGQGVSHALLSHMLEHAAWLGMEGVKLKCHLSNPAGLAYWHNLGLIPLSSDQDHEYFQATISGFGALLHDQHNADQ